MSIGFDDIDREIARIGKELVPVSASRDQLTHLLAEAAEHMRFGQAEGNGRDPQLCGDLRGRAGLDGGLPLRRPGPILDLVTIQWPGT
jgi:hypothetical protein